MENAYLKKRKIAMSCTYVNKTNSFHTWKAKQRARTVTTKKK